MVSIPRSILSVVEGIVNLDRELLAGSAVIARRSLNPSGGGKA
jgi:hypothetical protein